MPRSKISRATETEVLVSSRRRCALCFGLHQTINLVKGQIAHVDHNPTNNSLDNLVWLCLQHHDEYDSRSSQSKGLTPSKLIHYRQELYARLEAEQSRLEPNRTTTHFSPQGATLARFLNERSVTGDKFDPQVRVDTLDKELALSTDDIELAIDELSASGLLELSGSRDWVFATNRLFWETDPVFTDNDPANDARTVTRALVNHPLDAISTVDLAPILHWQLRRLNPAASYLAELGNARPRPALRAGPYCYGEIVRTTATKRFVRDLDHAGESVSASPSRLH